MDRNTKTDQNQRGIGCSSCCHGSTNNDNISRKSPLCIRLDVLRMKLNCSRNVKTIQREGITKEWDGQQSRLKENMFVWRSIATGAMVLRDHYSSISNLNILNSIRKRLKVRNFEFSHLITFTYSSNVYTKNGIAIIST